MTGASAVGKFGPRAFSKLQETFVDVPGWAVERCIGAAPAVAWTQQASETPHLPSLCLDSRASAENQTQRPTVSDLASAVGSRSESGVHGTRIFGRRFGRSQGARRAAYGARGGGLSRPCGGHGRNGQGDGVADALRNALSGSRSAVGLQVGRSRRTRKCSAPRRRH